MPAFRLATHDDMRAQTSMTPLEELWRLPWLYIPVGAVDIPLPPLAFATEGLDLMRTWGVAMESSIADYARLFPTALVAPKDFGPFVDRGELLYNGAEAVANFVLR